MYCASLKDGQFNLLVWLLLSLLSLLLHSKVLILQVLAINLQVLTEMRLGTLNMSQQIVGQVGITIKASLTEGKESAPL